MGLHKNRYQRSNGDMARPEAMMHRRAAKGAAAYFLVIMLYILCSVCAVAQQPDDQNVVNINTSTAGPKDDTPTSVWDWYWNRKAQIPPEESGRFFSDDALSNCFNFILYRFVAPAWNDLMLDDAVRGFVLVAVSGAVFGAAASDFMKRRDPDLQREREELKEYMQQVNLDRGRLLIDLKVAMEQLKELYSDSNDDSKPEPEWLQRARKDPGSTLTLLRRELERLFKALAQKHDPGSNKSREDLSVIIKELWHKKIITEMEYQHFTQIRRVLNTASHLGLRDEKTDRYVIAMAPGLISHLEKLLQEGSVS